MEFNKLSCKRVADHISQLSEQLLRARPRGKHIAQLLDIKDYPDQIAILVKAKSNLRTPQLEAMFCMRNSQIQPFLLFSFIFPQNNPILITAKRHAWYIDKHVKIKPLTYLCQFVAYKTLRLLNVQERICLWMSIVIRFSDDLPGRQVLTGTIADKLYCAWKKHFSLG